MKHTRGRFIGNIVSTIGGWPGAASGVWNRNDSAAASRSNIWPVYSAVPDSPTITGVTRVGGSGTSIDVAFTAPGNNGGQTITSYTAVSSPGSVTASISQAGSGTIRVTGLTQGTSYTFVVYATNVVGNSANSSASSALVAATVPGAPTIGAVARVAGSGTQIDVPYSAPASNGGLAITSYTAVSTPGSITGTLSQAGSGTIRVTGLTQGTSYTFTVYATNAVGNGTSSAASAAIAPATVPGAPTIGTAATSGTTAATVPFTAPADNGGSAITSYTAVSTPGSITGTLSQAGSGTITVSGLAGTTSYTFVVYATNAIGNSPNSASSNQITTPNPFQVNYMVVGAGGGGGSSSGGPSTNPGAGGAGGILDGTLSPPSWAFNTTYTVTVGAGVYDENGQSSSISGTGVSITALGGGRGSRAAGGGGTASQVGGSGGGGSQQNTAGAAGTPGQGNAGGSGVPYGGGGGGGKATAANGSTGGDGGYYANYTNFGTPAGYFGGGGNRAGTQGQYAGGAPGGGGNSGACSTGQNGNTNTGGGGGSTHQGCDGTAATTGGSGIVIVRYPDAYQAATVTGAPTYTTPAGYRQYAFTGSGSINIPG